ncbi:MAG: dihydroorotate dehydrogenase electron transfer subunit [Candidatus Kerfeldbacteria bacterium]|nr:dihydroorotate dehydrogenase electron transfer subunit [Candidatus Kerfeldbacteria bacterium]
MKDWLCKNDQPLMLPIQRIEDEAEGVKTYYFSHRLNSRPGQFVMMWIPRLNEKPFSIAYDTGEEFGLAIAAIGPFTQRLAAMKVGDRVGIRGPYGKPFTIVDNAKHVVMVGGGYGVAPLATFAEQLRTKSSKIHFINGARSEHKLLFRDRLAKLDAETYYTTDDGSFGEKGRVTAPLERILKTGSVDFVYTCGPEMMEKAVFDLAEKYNVPSQISIERYMKCGYGICGACSVDGTGQPVCCDGPVVTNEQARTIREFGVHHRKGSGRKEMFA